MRYARFLIIPAAFVAGLYAVNTVQAQTYSKTGYNPHSAGSVVTFSSGGQSYATQAQNTAVYSKTGTRQHYQAPQVQYEYAPAPTQAHQQIQYVQEQPQVIYAEPIIEYVNAPQSHTGYGQQQQQVIYAEPPVQIIHDTSGLPGYGKSTTHQGYGASSAVSANEYPAVYARPGSATQIMQTVGQGTGYSG